MKAAGRPVQPAKGPLDCPRGPGLWSAAPWRGTGPDTAPRGAYRRPQGPWRPLRTLWLGGPRPQAHLEGPEYLLRAVATRGSVAALSPQARCSGALGGAKRGRESGGALLKSAAEKIEGAPFRVLPLLLNKGRPVWVGQVLFLPSAPALVGSGGRQVCSIAGSS